MKRKKKPTRRRKPARKKKSSKKFQDQKEKIEEIISGLSEGYWNPDERETSILFDYSDKVVHLETSFGPTARRWFRNLWGDPKVKWDTSADTLKFSVPWKYCRSADLIIKHKHREYNDK